MSLEKSRKLQINNMDITRRDFWSETFRFVNSLQVILGKKERAIYVSYNASWPVGGAIVDFG